jgi:hypothetical protein
MDEAHSFVCPFCKGKVHVDVSDDPGLIHELPTCQRFDLLEPDAFLEAVNNEQAVTAEARARLQAERAAWERKHPSEKP